MQEGKRKPAAQEQTAPLKPAPEGGLGERVSWRDCWDTGQRARPSTSKIVVVCLMSVFVRGTGARARRGGGRGGDWRRR